MSQQLAHQPFSKFRRVKTALAFLLLSLCGALALENTALFWEFFSRLPHSLSGGISEVLLLSPIQPLEVHDQEEQLEFLIAWVFSLPLVAISALLWRKLRSRHPAVSDQYAR